MHVNGTYFVIRLLASGQAFETSAPTQRDFSSNLYLQIGFGNHPASFPMGTRVPFPGAKARPGRDADHSTPSRSQEWVGAIPPLP
jgi:hypothetical protein